MRAGGSASIRRVERCVLELERYQNVNKRKRKKKKPIIGYGVDNFTSNRNAAPVGSIIVTEKRKEYQFPVFQRIGRVNCGTNRTFHSVVFATRDGNKPGFAGSEDLTHRSVVRCLKSTHHGVQWGARTRITSKPGSRLKALSLPTRVKKRFVKITKRLTPVPLRSL